MVLKYEFSPKLKRVETLSDTNDTNKQSIQKYKETIIMLRKTKLINKNRKKTLKNKNLER